MATANVVAAGHARRPTRQPGFTAAQRQDIRGTGTVRCTSSFARVFADDFADMQIY